MKSINQYISFNNEKISSINNYITEKLIIKKTGYKYFPKTKKELIILIEYRLNKEGNNADLNDIDVSEITDMSNLFYWSEFNGDISKWDVSNVENMESMFNNADFCGDISNWDCSSLKKFGGIFNRSPLMQNKENLPEFFKKIAN